MSRIPGTVRHTLRYVATSATKPFSTARRAKPYSWLLLFLLLTSLLLNACGPNNEAPQPSPTPEPNLKVSTVLLNIFVTYNTTQGSDEDKKKAAIQYARDARIINSQDNVVFEVTLDQPDREKAITDKIKAMGGTVQNSANMEGTVKLRVAVPVDAFISYTNTATKEHFLNDLAAFEGVKSIDLMVGRQTMEMAGMPQTEQALSVVAQTSRNEGIRLMGADKWQAAGFRGKGVKIGVIDSGFRYYQKFLGSTLPAGLAVKDIDAETGGPGTVDDSVHGTAVLEIITSLAPEADIMAVSVDGSDGEIKQGLDYLLAQGVSIVSVSLGGHSTAGDGSAAFDKYLERIRKDNKVVFLFASGNEGSSHYAGFFNPDPQGFHQFVPGVTRLAVGNPGNSVLDTYFILNWEQWGLNRNQINDLDIFVEDSNGRPVRGGSSQDSQPVRPPVEEIPIKLAPKQLYYVRIRQKPGTLAYTKPFRLHLFGHNTDFQFIVPQMSVADPADSKGALAVGAIQFEEDKLAYYSSQGPLPDGRFKPEISAPTGVSSRAYNEEGREVFDGTSAATPEAAGAAAILKSANPNLSADQLEALLKQTTKDLAPDGPDYANGYGRVNLGQLKPAAGITPQGEVAPAPVANTANLQFPVLVNQFYPAPKAGEVTESKVNAPTPLPTRSTSLDDGASDASKPGGPDTGSNPQPTPAGTKAPQPTGGPMPIANVVFRDNFKDSASGLPVGANASYQNGAYKVKAGEGVLNWSVYAPALLSATDFGAEVTVQGISAKEGVYGLIFWYTDVNNYYLLSVNGSGQYQISQYNGGSYQEVLGWNDSPGWKANAANLLRLTANRGTITVSINNQPGKSGQASGHGSFGFAAGSYGGPVEATFTNFNLSVAR